MARAHRMVLGNNDGAARPLAPRTRTSRNPFTWWVERRQPSLLPAFSEVFPPSQRSSTCTGWRLLEREAVSFKPCSDSSALLSGFDHSGSSTRGARTGDEPRGSHRLPPKRLRRVGETCIQSGK